MPMPTTQAISQFVDSSRVISVNLVDVIFLYQSRNEWVNWNGDTNNVHRPVGGPSFSIEEATAKAESFRAPGTKFDIQDTVAIAVKCDKGYVLLYEYFTDAPFSQFKTVIKKRADLSRLKDLIAALPSTKFLDKKFFIENSSPAFQNFSETKQHFKRRAKAGGSLNGLAWTLTPYPLKFEAAKNVVSLIKDSVAASIATKVNVQQPAAPTLAKKLTAPSSVETTLDARPQTSSDVSDVHQTAEGLAGSPKLGESLLPPETTQREQLNLARVGQGLYRKRLQSIEHSCRITGLTENDHLIASHIKPWRDCDDTEKLDGNNGLLLSPHVDHLFDKGYISFTDSGDLIVSNQLSHHVLELWNLKAKANVGAFNENQRHYLAYHREHIYTR